MKKTAIIEDWVATTDGVVIYLVGRILDHYRQDSFKKKYQITSPVKSISSKLDRAETMNTIYLLGTQYVEEELPCEIGALSSYLTRIKLVVGDGTTTMN